MSILRTVSVTVPKVKATISGIQRLNTCSLSPVCDNEESVDSNLFLCWSITESD
jgi:hypothetical protein